MALRERFAECRENAVDSDDRANLQQASQHYHIERLDHIHFSSSVHGIDSIDIDVHRRLRRLLSLPLARTSPAKAG